MAKIGHCTERKMTIFKIVEHYMQLFNAHSIIQLIISYYTNKAIYIYDNTPIKASRIKTEFFTILCLTDQVFSDKL